MRQCTLVAHVHINGVCIDKAIITGTAHDCAARAVTLGNAWGKATPWNPMPLPWGIFDAETGEDIERFYQDN